MIAYDALIKYIGTAKKASPECPLLDVHFAYYKVLKPYRQHLAKEAEELILKPNGTQHLGVFFQRKRNEPFGYHLRPHAVLLIVLHNGNALFNALAVIVIAGSLYARAGEAGFNIARHYCRHADIERLKLVGKG